MPASLVILVRVSTTPEGTYNIEGEPAAENPAASSAARFSVVLSSGDTFGPVDIETVQEWARQGRVPTAARLQEVGKAPVPAIEHPALRAILMAPPTVAGPMVAPDSSLSVLIPARNPPALMSYYCGIAGLIPALGVVFGPLSIVLGVKGLARAKELPRMQGRTHAIVGIIAGSIGCLINLGFVALVVVGIFR